MAEKSPFRLLNLGLLRENHSRKTVGLHTALKTSHNVADGIFLKAAVAVHINNILASAVEQSLVESLGFALIGHQPLHGQIGVFHLALLKYPEAVIRAAVIHQKDCNQAIIIAGVMNRIQTFPESTLRIVHRNNDGNLRKQHRVYNFSTSFAEIFYNKQHKINPGRNDLYDERQNNPCHPEQNLIIDQPRLHNKIFLPSV